jgi:hypothetical protein
MLFIILDLMNVRNFMLSSQITIFPFMDFSPIENSLTVAYCLFQPAG